MRCYIVFQHLFVSAQSIACALHESTAAAVAARAAVIVRLPATQHMQRVAHVHTAAGQSYAIEMEEFHAPYDAHQQCDGHGEY